MKTITPRNALKSAKAKENNDKTIKTHAASKEKDEHVKPEEVSVTTLTITELTLPNGPGIIRNP
jgi:hypothetical protein